MTAGQRRVLITGVNRGLGYELARLLIERGDQVWGTTRGHAVDLALAGRVTLDLMDESSIAAGVAELAIKIEALDLLINCAGLDSRAFLGDDDQARGPFDMEADVYAKVFHANAVGPISVTQHALPLLRSGRAPMVINISSQLGSMEAAAGKGRDTPYCVSKAALNMFSVKAAAALQPSDEQPDGIGVVMIHPGWVQTGMGGPQAPLRIDEACASIVETVNGLTIADTGTFLNWDGSVHPW